MKSELMSAFLAEARSLSKRRAHDAATERAARVFLSEGREVFAPADQALFDAMLARLDPPAGFESWDAWFAYDAAHPMPEDTRSDDEIIDELQRKAGRIPLHDAADAGDLVLVEKLLADGADVNAVWDRGSLQWTPLCASRQKVYERCARQSTPELKRVVAELLARARA